MKKHFIGIFLILSLFVTATASAGPLKKAGKALALSASVKYLINNKKLKNLGSVKHKKLKGVLRRLKNKRIKRIHEKLKVTHRKKQSKANISKLLPGFKSSRFNIGGINILLDKKGMKHILERHHPRYWAGGIKATQSFFPKNITIPEIKSLIYQVLEQNKGNLTKVGRYDIRGVVNGVNYKLGLNKGRVAAFFEELTVP